MPATKDLSKLLSRVSKGSWAALSKDEERLVAYAPTLPEVLEKAKKAGEDNPVVIRVPESESVVFLPTV